jgi:S1-C subfamily serine protease
VRQILTRCLALFVSTTILLGVSVAKIDLNSVVYIECYAPDGAHVSSGSGIIVSDDGRILTAKHVVPPNASCKGVRGTGAKTPDRDLVHGRRSNDYDAAIMRFVPNPGERFNPVRYVRLTPEMQGQSITAYGFPDKELRTANGESSNSTGQISARRGIISTTVPNKKGWIETDALTARGMSGGPVILDADNTLIGIITAATFDNLSSAPTNYGVLAAQRVANELGLVASKAKRVLADGSSGTVQPEPQWVCETVPPNRYKFRLHKFEIYGDSIDELRGTVEFVRADNYDEMLMSGAYRNSGATRISLHIGGWLNPDCDTQFRMLVGMPEEVSALCFDGWKGHTKVGVNPLIVYLKKNQSVLDATRHIKLCVKGRGVTVENVGSED